jgi:microcystin degradation protein MlrC
MAVYAISFRVGDKGNRQARWESIVEHIRKQSSDTITWEETTSFFLLRSNKPTSEVATRIYVDSLMDNDHDKLLVINLSVKEHFAFGKMEYPATLEGLLESR